MLGTVCGGGVLVTASLVGWTDPGAAWRVAGAGAATSADAFALVGFLCWLGIAATAAVLVSGSVQRPVARAPRFRLVVLLAASTLLLVTGIVRHASTFSVCCASPASAHEAEQSVP